MIPRSEVSKLVGEPFIDEKDGYAWGCLQLAPMYEVLPEMLEIRYPVSEDCNMLQHFQKHCKEVQLKEMKYGDLIVVKLPKNQWHLMVYLGEGKAIHCTGHTCNEIIHYDIYKNRIKGVFRYV